MSYHVAFARALCGKEFGYRDAYERASVRVRSRRAVAMDPITRVVYDAEKWGRFVAEYGRGVTTETLDIVQRLLQENVFGTSLFASMARSQSGQTISTGGLFGTKFDLMRTIVSAAIPMVVHYVVPKENYNVGHVYLVALDIVRDAAFMANVNIEDYSDVAMKTVILILKLVTVYMGLDVTEFNARATEIYWMVCVISLLEMINALWKQGWGGIGNALRALPTIRAGEYEISAVGTITGQAFDFARQSWSIFKRVKYMSYTYMFVVLVTFASYITSISATVTYLTKSNMHMITSMRPKKYNDDDLYWELFASASFRALAEAAVAWSNLVVPSSNEVKAEHLQDMMDFQRGEIPVDISAMASAPIALEQIEDLKIDARSPMANLVLFAKKGGNIKSIDFNIRSITMPIVVVSAFLASIRADLSVATKLEVIMFDRAFIPYGNGAPDRERVVDAMIRVKLDSTKRATLRKLFRILKNKGYSLIDILKLLRIYALEVLKPILKGGTFRVLKDGPLTHNLPTDEPSPGVTVLTEAKLIENMSMWFIEV